MQQMQRTRYVSLYSRCSSSLLKLCTYISHNVTQASMNRLGVKVGSPLTMRKVMVRRNQHCLLVSYFLPVMFCSTTSCSFCLSFVADKRDVLLIKCKHVLGVLTTNAVIIVMSKTEWQCSAWTGLNIILRIRPVNVPRATISNNREQHKLFSIFFSNKVILEAVVT